MTRLAAFAVVLLMLPACAADRAHLLTPGQVRQIDKLFAPWRSEQTPGAAVGVVRNGALVFARGYGQANLEHRVPNAPSTAFRIASTSKQFTAACVFVLERDGRPSLDDDVRQHLSELPEFAALIRVRDFVHHTSGIRNYLNLLILARIRETRAITQTDIIQLIARQQALNFPPADQHRIFRDPARRYLLT